MRFNLFMEQLAALLRGHARMTMHACPSHASAGLAAAASTEWNIQAGDGWSRS
jgi:hypothetical protein